MAGLAFMILAIACCMRGFMPGNLRRVSDDRERGEPVRATEEREREKERKRDRDERDRE
jgi:hypothetical protein